MTKCAARILQTKEQIHVEFNKLNAEKNFMLNFLIPCLKDMKCALNMVDSDVNGYLHLSLKCKGMSESIQSFLFPPATVWSYLILSSVSCCLESLHVYVCVCVCVCFHLCMCTLFACIHISLVSQSRIKSH